MPDQDETFYEGDEAVEDVVAAFEGGVKGVTSNPLVQTVNDFDFVVPLLIPAGQNEIPATSSSGDDQVLAGLVNA